MSGDREKPEILCRKFVTRWDLQRIRNIRER